MIHSYEVINTENHTFSRNDYDRNVQIVTILKIHSLLGSHVIGTRKNLLTKKTNKDYVFALCILNRRKYP